MKLKGFVRGGGAIQKNIGRGQEFSFSIFCFLNKDKKVYFSKSSRAERGPNY